MKDNRKFIKGLLVWIPMVFAAVFLVLGCGSKYMDNEAMEDEFENAPEWVLLGHDPGIFSAVGSARIGKSGMQFAKTAALAQARNELARQIGVKVQAVVNTVARQMGMGEGQTVDQVGRQVSRHVTQETLNGSRQKEIWISPQFRSLRAGGHGRGCRKKVPYAIRCFQTLKEDREQWESFREMPGESGLDREIQTAFLTHYPEGKMKAIQAEVGEDPGRAGIKKGAVEESWPLVCQRFNDDVERVCDAGDVAEYTGLYRCFDEKESGRILSCGGRPSPVPDEAKDLSGQYRL